MSHLLLLYILFVDDAGNKSDSSSFDIDADEVASQKNHSDSDTQSHKPDSPDGVKESDLNPPDVDKPDDVNIGEPFIPRLTKRVPKKTNRYK